MYNIDFKGFWKKSNFIFIVVLVIGMALKLVNVNERQFWYDEIYTIWHTSGFHHSELDNLVSKDEPVNISFYKKLLKNNEQNYNFWEQQKRIYSRLNLNPFHYTLLSVWIRIVGDSPIHYRYLNIVLFLLILPLLYALGKNLLSSSRAALILVSLFAVSPFFHYYAHEARYNIPVAFFIILSHLFYLKLNKKSKLIWVILYTLFSIFALYSSLLMTVVLTGHLIHSLLTNRKNYRFYTAGFFIFIGYLPWMIFVYTEQSKLTEAFSWHWMFGKNMNFFELIFAQLMGFANSFINLCRISELRQFIMKGNFNNVGLQLFFSIVLISILIWSIIVSWKKLPKKNFYFLLCVFCSLPVFFLVYDVIKGTGNSIVYKYNMHSYLTVLFFLAFMLDFNLLRNKLSAFGIYTFIVILCLYSTIKISNSPCWSIPYYCEGRENFANLVSEKPHPLIISNEANTELFWGNFIAFLNECTSEDIDIFYATGSVSEIEETIENGKYSDIYVVYASSELIETLKSRYEDRMENITLKIGHIPETYRIND